MATKKNSAFLNFVPAALIHEAKSKEGQTFYNVSVPYKQSKNGYLSVSVRAAQVLAATKPARAEDGTKIEGQKVAVDGFKTVLLGNPETERTCTYCTKLATGKRGKATYGEVKLTNAKIRALYEESRAEYKAAQAATAEAEAEIEG